MLCRPLQWFARGGSHLNFYNWAGGNQFARNEGGSISNAYYWKAGLDEGILPLCLPILVYMTNHYERNT